MPKYEDVDDYMTQLQDDRRAAMEQLRSTIRAAAPDATEAISYNMPSFRQDSRFLVSYEAFKRHYSLFPWNDEMVEELGEELNRTPSGRARSVSLPTGPSRSIS